MSIVKEQGTIHLLGEVKQGTSQNGNAWMRQSVVIEVPSQDGNSVRKVSVDAGTQMCEELAKLKKGDKVNFSYIVSAREWQGKWYNNVNLYDIQKVAASAKPSRPTPPVEDDPHEDLPF